MSVIDDLKQALQDVLAPEIRANTQAIAELQLTLAAIRSDLSTLGQRVDASVQRVVEASETRMLEAIEAAKTKLQLQPSLPIKKTPAEAYAERISEPVPFEVVKK